MPDEWVVHCVVFKCTDFTAPDLEPFWPRWSRWEEQSPVTLIYAHPSCVAVEDVELIVKAVYNMVTPRPKPHVLWSRASLHYGGATLFTALFQEADIYVKNFISCQFFLAALVHVSLISGCSFECFAMMQFAHLWDPAIAEVRIRHALCYSEPNHRVHSKFIWDCCC